MVPTRNAPTDSLVDLLADLVAFPTESRTSNLELIDLYADRAAAAGAAVTVVPGEAGRANLHLRFGPDAPGGLLLSGHTDVVPAGSGWATDPYELTEVDGQLRARGSADMKGFLAAALVLMEATDVDALRAPVHLGLSYDEEIGCVGVHGLLDVLAAGGSCSPDVVVVGEPTSMRLCNAHAGKVGHRLDLVAAAGHSSRAGVEPSAIHEAADLAVLIHAVNERISGLKKDEDAELATWMRPLVAIGLLGAGTLISRFGLIDLIAVGYGTLTIGFIIVYVIPVLTLGVWKVHKGPGQ